MKALLLSLLLAQRLPPELYVEPEPIHKGDPSPFDGVVFTTARAIATKRQCDIAEVNARDLEAALKEYQAPAATGSVVRAAAIGAAVGVGATLVVVFLAGSAKK